MALGTVTQRLHPLGPTTEGAVGGTFKKTTIFKTECHGLNPNLST